MPSSSSAPADPGLRIEAMAQADLESVLAIERVAYRQPWKREHFIHEIEHNPFAFNRVVVVEGRVVAYACAWFLAGELQLNNLAVHPDWRARGLGGRLLDALLDAASAADCDVARLEVRPSNHAALALYRSRGFERVGRRVLYYASDGEDAWLLARRLGPSPSVSR